MTPEFYLLRTEIAVALLGLLLLILGPIFRKSEKNEIGIANIAVIGFISTLGIALIYGDKSATFLDGMFIIDPFATFFKGLILIAVILVCLISKDYIIKEGHGQGEYYSLLAFAVLGMMVMISAGDLITLFIGLELSTLSLVILSAFRRNNTYSTEAGMKYVVLSAFSSAVLLYGFSLIYGATQTTHILEISNIITAEGISPILLLGMIFSLAGFAFKISAVPFHMWSPDVYEGAPTPITAFLSVASKAAAFAIFIRFFMVSLAPLQEFWLLVIIVLTVLTLFLGNIVAIPQTNIKRMLAYSSIGQAGFIFLGIIAFSELGMAALLLHSLLYVFGNIGAFGVVTVVGKAIGSDKIEDYSGLWKKAPFMAAVLFLSMISLAGLPPLAGFIGKFYLFIAVIEQGYLWLAFVGVGVTMISVYYYLIVVRAMYLGKPTGTPTRISIPNGAKITLSICLLVIIVFGVYPAPLVDLTTYIASTFFPL